MGLKGYRLWVMGQLDSTCRAPPRQDAEDEVPMRNAAHTLYRFEKGKGLKPVFRLIGARVGKGWQAGVQHCQQDCHL
jgi:hypothetical protein